jgi:membrane protease YdiL (CAAX protease family)
MRADGFLPALNVVTSAFFLVTGVYVYASLARQITSRVTPPDLVPTRRFGWPEALLATFLSCFFLLPVLVASPSHPPQIHDRDLVNNALLTLGMLIAVAGFLRLRGFHVSLLAGFSEIGFFRTIVTGALLILAAYPLIFLADFITQRLVPSAPRKQEIVELFNGSITLEQRVIIIVLAISVAPLVEEFIFRFFIYGVVKRYVGRVAGIAVSALLFAAVHAHLPSFAPLFVLGSCLAIAYEWSGSILVPMTMHALFNAFTLTALAFPEHIRQ